MHSTTTAPLTPADVTGFNAAFPRIGGRPATRVVEPAHGPVMIEHPALRMGRPVSLLDVWYASVRLAHGLSSAIAASQRVVPADRDFSKSVVFLRGEELELVDVERLHAEYLAHMNHWKGRPTSLLRYPLPTLIAWRDAFFAGDLQLRRFAREVDLSEPAASRFIHGETLWYV